MVRRSSVIGKRVRIRLQLDRRPSVTLELAGLRWRSTWHLFLYPRRRDFMRRYWWVNHNGTSKQELGVG